MNAVQALVCFLATYIATGHVRADDNERRVLYVAEPGIRNYVESGGHGILVFDQLTDEEGRIVQSEKMLEIDFVGDQPVRAGDRSLIRSRRAATRGNAINHRLDCKARL